MFTRKNILLFSLLIIVYATSFSQNFVTEWTVLAGDEITIPTSGGGYNCTVDWGDFSTPTTHTGTTPLISHTYVALGTYTVTISGTFRRIYFNDIANANSYTSKITSIEEWGSNHSWTSMSRAFEGCTNLVNNASDTPVLSSATSLNRMFYGASSIGSGSTNWNSWDVSNITSMNSMFREASDFNEDLNSWTTTSVTNLGNIFRDATAFNGNISLWNTSLVTNMTQVFRGTTSFNQDISGWVTSSATTMSHMFRDATSFNQNIGGWTTNSVTNMTNMFYGATAFNQNIGLWNTTLVTNFSVMFRNAIAFNQDISGWVTTSAVNMSQMFYDAILFNANLSSWTTTSATNFSNMFRGASAFNQDISMWNTAAVTNMQNMFFGAIAFNQDISGWSTGAVIIMQNMFRNATSFDQNLGGWDITGISHANTMKNMFLGITLSLSNYNALLIGWDNQNTGITFHGGNSKYCATTERASMISDGWIITDGGELTSFIWEGGTDTDWNDSTNWQDGYDSNCPLDISIPTVTNHPIIDASTVVFVNNLTIDSGASLTINGGITIGGNLTTNNGLTLNSGGSIIVTGTSTGNLNYNRNIPVAEKWYHVSSPLLGETIDNYISSNSLATGNGNVGLFYYDNNTTSGYAGSGFIFYTPSSIGSFTAGKGYGTQVSTSSDIVFTGTMPNSDTSITISEGTLGNITPDPSNLIGNPFPSYIAANTNANASNILTNNTSVLDEESLYLWDNTINDYVTINNGSAAYYLPPGQGIFVNSTSSGGSFNFLESDQSHQTTDVFYRTTDPNFRINLSLTNTNNERKITQIFYFDHKTVNFDNGYDSSSLSDGSESLLINTRLVGNHNSQNLAIQTLPTENLQNYVIPLNIKGSGKITFSADATSTPNNVSIILEDRLLNTFNLLDFENVYTIDVGTSINGIGRFYLHTQNKALSLNDNFLNLISIYTSENKHLNISGLPNNKTKVILFDILGKQLIKEIFIADNTTKEISLSEIKNGVYIVKLETEKGVISKKIILE